nr:MAG TPA: hypothetical protein [Caudoviricetes sp.]
MRFLPERLFDILCLKWRYLRHWRFDIPCHFRVDCY